MKNKQNCCKDCNMGKDMIINADILCRKNGIVSPEYSCNKFKSRPKTAIELKKVLQIIPEVQNTEIPTPMIEAQLEIAATSDVLEKNCVSCIYFKVLKNDAPQYGTCSIFTVRPYMADSRKGCSKYVMTEISTLSTV